MLLSMVTISHAADEIVVESWNANTTQIVLDLSHEVQDITSYVTLTKNLQPVEFTVSKLDKTISSTLAEEDVVEEGAELLKAMTSDKNFTYVIKPAGGVTIGDTYVVTLKEGLANNDGSAVLSKQVQIGIILENIWTEDFDDYTAETLPWVATKSVPVELVDDLNGGKALKSSRTGGNYWAIKPNFDSATNFADTGVPTKDYIAKKNKPGNKINDFNVEFDVRMSVPTDMWYKHGIRVSLKPETSSHDSNVKYGLDAIHAGIGAETVDGDVKNKAVQGFEAGVVDSKYNTGTPSYVAESITTLAGGDQYPGDYGFFDLAPYADITTHPETGANYTASLLKNSNLNDENTANDNVNTIAMSVKDKNLKFFANETGYISYDYTIDLINYGNIEILFEAVGECIYILDNVRVTKAREIPLAPLTVVDYNGDSTKITLDLSAPVNVRELENALTLKENDKVVDYTLTEKTQAYKSQGALQDGPYTYVIVPAGGMKLDTAYEINLAAGISASDYSGTLASSYTKKFEVYKVWKETFENYGTGTFNAWGVNSGQSTADSTSVTLSGAEGDKSLRIDKVTKNIVVMNFTKNTTQNFADTDAKISSKPNGGLTDFTVELKVAFENDPATTTTDFRVGAMNSVHTNLGYSNGFFAGIRQSSGNYYTTAFANKKNGSTHNAEQATSNGSQQAAYSTNYCGQIAVSPFVQSGENHLTLAMKGKNFKFFSNDNVFNSYNTSYEIGAYGLVQFMCTSNVALVDDIIVTKVREYTQTVVSAPSYLNADTSKIIVDWDADVSVAEFGKGVSLYENAKKLVNGVDYTIVKLDNSKTTVTNNGVLSSAYSYKIVPVEGIKEDCIYTVGIEAGSYSNAEKRAVYVLENDYSNSFKVERIIYEYFDYSNDLPLPWRVEDGVPLMGVIGNDEDGNNYFVADASDAAYKFTNDGRYSYEIDGEEVLSQNYANTGTYAYSIYRGNSSKYPQYNADVINHNVECKVRVADETAKYSFTMLVTDKNHTSSGRPCAKVVLAANAGANAKITTDIDVPNKDTDGAYDWYNIGDASSATVSGANLSSEDFTNVSISMIGKNIKVNVNDILVNYNTGADYESVSANTAPQFTMGAGNVYYIDDYIVSKMVPVADGIACGAFKFVFEGSEIPGLGDGADIVDISVDVVNFGGNKNCQIVLAGYNSESKAMTTTKLWDKKVLNSGSTTLEFKDVVLNGGDKVTVFFWDSFENLSPYRATYSYPDDWTPEE